MPSKRGFCTQCHSAYTQGLNEILGESIRRRDRMRAAGDEPGIAAADAYQAIVLEIRRRLR